MNTNGKMVDRPSQWLNVGYFLLTFVGFIIHPILGGVILLPTLYKSLELYTTRWVYGEQSIVQTKGVFFVSTDEIEFFRIKDIQVDEPLLYRFVGLSNVTIVSSDTRKPVMVMKGITQGDCARVMLKSAMMINRRKEKVTSFDFM